MRVGSLCTGYGGLEMGLRTVFPQARMVWCADNDKAASILLAARYGVPNLGDIKLIDWSLVEPVDVLAAGIPCQPHSYAGKGRGKDDDRDLVDAFINAVRGLRPRVVLLENVPGFKRYGLPRVLGALAALGFDAVWHSVRASEAGASHRRERILVLAYPADDGREWGWLARLWRAGLEDRDQAFADAGCQVGQREPDDKERQPERRDASPERSQVDWGEYGPAVRRQERVFGRLAPLPTEIGSRGNVRLAARFPEWMMGVPNGWVTDFGFTRKDTFRLIGNGVVPLQAALGVEGLIREEADRAYGEWTQDGYGRAA